MRTPDLCMGATALCDNLSSSDSAGSLYAFTFSSTKHLSLHYYIFSILSLLAYNCISTVCILLKECFEFQNVDMLCFSSRVGLSLLTSSLPASNKRKKEFGHFFSP